MKSTILATAIVALFGLVNSAQAQVYNPENDSTAYFASIKVSAKAAAPAARLPQVGEVSPDGLQVYSGGDRGWVNRTHAYAFAGGRMVHTQDCLPFNAPKVAGGGSVTLQSGAFADHGV